jgi:polyisoprenoid-binding protein YceI
MANAAWEKSLQSGIVMNLRLALFSLFAFTSLPALAETTKTVPSWTIVKESSTLGFEGEQMGASFKGNFKSFDGTIQFDPNNLGMSKVNITIPIDSIEANSTDRNKYARMPDWFDTAKFPDAHFVTTSIEKGLDKNQYVAKGNLTIRDVTLPITLPFMLDIIKTDSGESVAKMNAQTSVNRLDYNVGQGEWKDTQSVGNQVKINISLTAKQKS